MTTGIAVALAIICSQLFYSQSISLRKKETKTEQHQQESSDDDQVYITGSLYKFAFVRVYGVKSKRLFLI